MSSCGVLLLNISNLFLHDFSCAVYSFSIYLQPKTCDAVMSALTTLMKCRLIEQNENNVSRSESGALQALGEP